jgi:hypothetical protein
VKDDLDAPSVARLRLSTSVTLADITALALDAAIPAFADAAGVFVMEHLLTGAEPARRESTGPIAARRLGTRFAPAVRQAPAAFPSGEVIAFATDSPYAQCVRTGQPVVFTEPDRQTLQRAHHGGREVFSRYASFLAVPMNAEGSAAGFLVFARASAAIAFSERDAAVAARLAAHAGTGVANALTLTRHRAIAGALERGLLAADPPRPARIEVAGRCLPAAGQAIGGDWYDIIPLPAERTGLIIGDVMGHGPEAAAVMAQLRAAAHALAQLDLQPAELLGQVNRTTATLRDVTLATCVYAVIDPGGPSCTITAAGHLPPVLAMPDGTTRVPDLPAGQSLGLGPSVYGQARIKLPPGAIIALYTDGLVETRTRSFEQGIMAMRSVLARAHGPLDAVCDTLIRDLAGQHEDDVTVILARIPNGT